MHLVMHNQHECHLTNFLQCSQTFQSFHHPIEAFEVCHDTCNFENPFNFYYKANNPNKLSYNNFHIRTLHLLLLHHAKGTFIFLLCHIISLEFQDNQSLTTIKTIFSLGFSIPYKKCNPKLLTIRMFSLVDCSCSWIRFISINNLSTLYVTMCYLLQYCFIVGLLVLQLLKYVRKFFALKVPQVQ